MRSDGVAVGLIKGDEGGGVVGSEDGFDTEDETSWVDAEEDEDEGWMGGC